MQPESDAPKQDRVSRVVIESLSAYVRDASTMQQLYRIAERFGRLPRDALDAREVVTDVIEDICTGEAKCDPERELFPQVERHVRRRANRLRKANRPGGKRRGPPRIEFVPLDRAPMSALAVEPRREAVSEDEDNAVEPAELAARIRELARGDGQVQQLLALYDREIVARRDVLDAGMTDWVYRAARDRLTRYGELARSGASTAAHLSQTDAEDGNGAVFVASAGLGAPKRTERARRAVRRPLRRPQKLRSA
jgi:hypothetical protein